MEILVGSLDGTLCLELPETWVDLSNKLGEVRGHCFPLSVSYYIPWEIRICTEMLEVSNVIIEA